MSSRALNWLLPTALAVLLLGLWQAWTTLAAVPSYLVPSPWLIAQTLVQDWDLLSAAWVVTVQITVMAFVCAVILGSLLAFIMVQSRWLEAALLPYAILLQVTPIVAIAPLVIIWVKDPTQALVICATVVALFPIVSNTTVGLRSVHPGLQDYFRLQGASRWQTLWRLRLPSALPFMLAGWRISGGLALIGAVVAEFVAGTGGTQAGLAYQILQAGYQLNIPRLFAALTLITATGLIVYLVLSALTRWSLSGWHESERREP
ncbi:MAG: ABC transporter permease [Burkholderiales bacterium]|nr:ABC transporter permease [Burkholderiales bacterium]MDE2076773.1 ABC transporter permease [Burkholderiales bacterium]MDE2433866.1 ABC transporter permease [Burkholderiales bacterium]